MGPAARMLLLRNNLNGQDITPTGPRGTLLKEDVVNFLASGKTSSARSSTKKTSEPAKQQQAAPSSGGSRSKIVFTDIEHGNTSHGEALVQAKFSVPHLYLTVECQIDDLLANLNKINGVAKSNISLTDFAIRALVQSFQATQQARTKKSGGINVAVTLQNSEKQTITSSIQSADKKSLLALSDAVQKASSADPSAQLTSDPNRYTVSFVEFPGGLGVTEYTEILPSGHSCVLSMGNVEKKVIIQGDRPVIGQTVKLTLTCDGRLFLHSEAGEMAKLIRSFFESPSEMLI